MSQDGKLSDFRADIGIFLAGCDIPASPCYIRGAYAAFP